MKKGKFKILLLLTISLLFYGCRSVSSGKETSDEEDIDLMLFYTQRSILDYYYIYFNYPSIDELIEFHEGRLKSALEAMHPMEVKGSNIELTLLFLKKEKKQIRLVPEGNKLLFYFQEGIWEYDIDYCKDKEEYWNSKLWHHLFSAFDKNGKYIHATDYQTEWHSAQSQLNEKFPIAIPYIVDVDTISNHLFHYNKKEGLSFICPTDINIEDNPYIQELIFSLDTFMNNRKNIHSIHFLSTLRESK